MVTLPSAPKTPATQTRPRPPPELARSHTGADRAHRSSGHATSRHQDICTCGTLDSLYLSFIPVSSLTSFGGAGGHHACEIARLLNIRTVLIHRHSSILGLALANRDLLAIDTPSTPFSCR